MSQYEVVWNGATRRYLSPTLRDTLPASLPQTPPHTALDATGWLRGDHLRGYDLPRLRLATSLKAARWPFTVSDLAEAAKVSPTRARTCVAEERKLGRVRPAGVTARRSRQALYETV
jgi:hypothetical protein